MKRTLAALAVALATLNAPADAQTVQVTQIYALARVTGPFDLKYGFCTFAPGITNVTVNSYNVTISTGGRGARSAVLRANIASVAIIDASGTVLGGQGQNSLPVGCGYTLEITGTGVGTAGQGAVVTHVDVPYNVPPPPPPAPVDDNND